MNGFCMIGTSVRKELNVEDDFQGRLYSYCASFCLLLIKTSIYSSYLKYSLFQRIFSVPFAFINHFVPLLIPLLYSARHFRNQTNKQRKYFIVFFFSSSTSSFMWSEWSICPGEISLLKSMCKNFVFLWSCNQLPVALVFFYRCFIIAIFILIEQQLSFWM